jgi:hypothetical protein
MEFSEVASMAMELLAIPYLPQEQGGFFSAEELIRWQNGLLEKIILFWPYMAIVDAFQHWAYTHPKQGIQPDACDAKWAELWQRYIPDIDFSGFEDVMMTGSGRRGVERQAIHQRFAHPQAARFWINAALQAEVVLPVPQPHIVAEAHQPDRRIDARAGDLPAERLGVWIVFEWSAEDFERDVAASAAGGGCGRNRDVVSFQGVKAFHGERSHRPIERYFAGRIIVRHGRVADRLHCHCAALPIGGDEVTGRQQQVGPPVGEPVVQLLAPSPKSRAGLHSAPRARMPLPRHSVLGRRPAGDYLARCRGPRPGSGRLPASSPSRSFGLFEKRRDVVLRVVEQLKHWEV